jgi:hypothetical protein
VAIVLDAAPRYYPEQVMDMPIDWMIELLAGRARMVRRASPAGQAASAEDGGPTINADGTKTYRITSMAGLKAMLRRPGN